MFARKNKQIVVALEGIDGAGKTTLAKVIQAYWGNNVATIVSRTNKGKIFSSILKSNLIRRAHFLQIPIYLLLSYSNFIKTYKNSSIIIMDRCFLSNICYFYPCAMKSNFLLRIALFFELRLYPHKIYVIDVKPDVAHKRDNYQKDLDWLIETRENYLLSSRASCLSKFNIVIISDKLSIEEKKKIICNEIAVLKEIPV